MSWQDLPKPDGVGEITESDDGFEVAIAIPTDEDGFFGRECPSCEAPFKMRSDEYKALPDEIELTCPYCGHREEHSAFMSAASTSEPWPPPRASSSSGCTGSSTTSWAARWDGARAAHAGTHSSARLELHTRDPTGRARAARCARRADAACRRVLDLRQPPRGLQRQLVLPVCGPRPAGEKVLEAIVAAREALAVEDRLGEDERETLRAAGVFERFAVDAIESTVSLFEIFAREQFAQRVSGAQEHTKGKGNVFQRLDDTAALFSEHAGVDLVELAGDERWQRLKRTFARRHVLTHNGGIVDDKFLSQVPDSGLRLGQRLVVRRADATLALDDLKAVVHALARG